MMPDENPDGSATDNDTLTGGAGSDTFVFGRDHGDDVITDFVPGEDRIDLSAFSIRGFSQLTITSDDSGVTIDLTADGGGTIRLEGIDLDDLDESHFVFSRLDGGGTSADDVLQADDDGDRVEGGGGDDNITGDAGWDLLYGGTGNDTIAGGAGKDWLEGGEGDDELEGGEGADVLSGGAGNDTLRGGTGADTLAGHEGDDELHGGDGGDWLAGGEGADTIDGGSGDDEMFGDGGADVFVFGPGNGSDTIYDFVDGEDKIDLTAFSGISGFDDLSITSGDDGVTVDLTEHEGGTIFLDGVSRDDLDADDFIFGEPSATDREPPPVGDYDDWQYGTDGRDTFQGTTDDDRYDGLGENDEIHGNDGHDYLRGGEGHDRLWGDAGNDILVGGGTKDYLHGGAGDDRLYGGEGNDHIFGDEGTYDTRDDGDADTIYGGAGHDLIFGDGDDDTVYGGVGDDFIVGGSGDDTLYVVPGQRPELRPAGTAETRRRRRKLCTDDHVAAAKRVRPAGQSRAVHGLAGEHRGNGHKHPAIPGVHHRHPALPKHWTRQVEAGGTEGHRSAARVPAAAVPCSWWRRGRVELYRRHAFALLLAARTLAGAGRDIERRRRYNRTLRELTGSSS